MHRTYLKTEEHQMLAKMIEGFAWKELEPIAADLDKDSRFPLDAFSKLAELGILGTPVPEVYGGGGCDLTSICIVTEELAKVCPGFAMSVMVHLGMVEHGAFLTFANEEQKKEFLPPLCRGEMIGAFALTEPSAGSDASGVKTKAVRKNGGWVLNGSKTFITNPAADMECLMIVTAATAVKSDGKKRFSNFIVRKSDPGVSIGKKFDKLGMRSSPTSEIFFEDVLVPDQNLLGDEGKGIRQALTILDVDRILASCLAIGIIDRVLTDSINYSKTREQFDQPISNFQAIQFKLADMECDLRASRALLASVLEKEEDPTEFMMEAAALKLFSTSAAMKHTLEAIQIFGGYGYMKEYPPERFMRDNKILEIGGGSSEVLRIVLSREILK